jgi:glutamate synthase domain-containing protein 1
MSLTITPGEGHMPHDLVQKAIRALLHLEHGGACGCEKNAGNGAGIVLQLPQCCIVLDKIGRQLPLTSAPRSRFSAGKGKAPIAPPTK